MKTTKGNASKPAPKSTTSKPTPKKPAPKGK